MILRPLQVAVQVLLVAAVVSCGVGQAQEFRVDTELFRGPDKNPYSAQLTIFTADGTIYDFALSEPRQVTVFDSRRGVFTMLHEGRRQKATVTTQELLDFTLELESLAAQSKNPLLSFCAAPKFETTTKEIERNGQTVTEVRLAGKPLTYVAEGEKPQHSDAVKTYCAYADWCARLNSTVSRSLPARARMALNQALAEKELLPLEVTRTIPWPLPLSKKIEHRTQHRFNWKLSTEDQKKIQSAGDMIAKFEVIGYKEYCDLLTKDKEAVQ